MLSLPLQATLWTYFLDSPTGAALRMVCTLINCGWTFLRFPCWHFPFPVSLLRTVIVCGVSALYNSYALCSRSCLVNSLFLALFLACSKPFILSVAQQPSCCAICSFLPLLYWLLCVFDTGGVQSDVADGRDVNGDIVIDDSQGTKLAVGERIFLFFSFIWAHVECRPITSSFCVLLIQFVNLFGCRALIFDILVFIFSPKLFFLSFVVHFRISVF